MNDRDLQLVLAALKRAHPDIVLAIKALTAQQGTPVAAAATTLLHTLLQVFDEGEQAKWQLRDLLQRVKRGDGTHYLALKYSATEMVFRIACAGGMGAGETTYFDKVQPPEIQNWKSDITP